MFRVKRFMERTGVGVFAPAAQKPRRHVLTRQDSNRVMDASFATTYRSSEGDAVGQRAPLYRNELFRVVLRRIEERQRYGKRRGFEA